MKRKARLKYDSNSCDVELIKYLLEKLGIDTNIN